MRIQWPSSTLKVCIEGGELFSGQGSRCALHKRAPATYAEQRAITKLKQAWVAQYGLLCPGYKRAAHQVSTISQLSGDHVVPVVRGGRHGPMRVLCISCNSARRDERR